MGSKDAVFFFFFFFFFSWVAGHRAAAGQLTEEHHCSKPAALWHVAEYFSKNKCALG